MISLLSQKRLGLIPLSHFPVLYTTFLCMAPKMIPCFFMRGGTSRGVYFLRDHLPRNKETLDQVLLAVMGSPDSRQIDGLGGATNTTSKVAILSRASEPGVDVDYLHAEVSVTTPVVNWEPSCGNILAGVGPAAIEMGLVPHVGRCETKIKIRLLNTGGVVEAVVQTPGGQVTYEGSIAIAGVPGTAAPIALHFTNIVGSQSGGVLLPTGRLRDVVNGVEVSCIDCAVPIVVAAAEALGKTAYESKADLDADAPFLRRLEALRRAAGQLMGLGDVAGKVIPKIAILAQARRQGSLTARYFVPGATHAAIAVTGAISISCCSVLEGTVAYDMSTKRDHPDSKNPELHHCVIEHPSGEMTITLNAKMKMNPYGMDVYSAGVLRTARLLFTGMVRVPSKPGLELWEEPAQYREIHNQFCNLFRSSGPNPLDRH